MLPGESWWPGNGHECFELFKTIVVQLWFKVVVAYPYSHRNAILHIRTATVHVFVAIPGLPWEIVDNRNLPSTRIQYKYLKMSYEYSRVGLQVPRNILRKFVVDHMSTTVLDGSVTVLSGPHYGV